MTDPDAVARALARLASSTPRKPQPSEHDPEQPPLEQSPPRVVADAEASMERVDRAAAFVDAGGEEQLRHAVQRAEEAGDDPLAARGRAVLSTLSAFRRAATAGEEPGSEPPSERRTTSTPLAQRSSGEGA